MAKKPRVVFSSPYALEASIGSDLGSSGWHTITQEEINLFAEATGDFQWIHVDVERAARESAHGATIAHGYLTLALIPALQKEIFRVDGIAYGLNYGLDRVRFLTPVRVGGRVRCRASILSADNVASGVRAVVRTTIELQGSDRPALVAEAIVLYAPSAGQPIIATTESASELSA